MPSNPRSRTVLIWILAVVITLAAVVYQRLIGPTRPVRGQVMIGTTEIAYELKRSHGGAGDHQVRIEDPAEALAGHLLYRRHKTDDPWTRRELARNGEALVASIPHQPPAGKVLYRVHLRPIGGGAGVALPPEGPTVVRFRGGVPAWAMIPHVIFMFLAMLWSNRAGLGALRRGENLRRLAFLSFALMVVGGLIFGPAVQWYAFGAAWTGFPVGTDLTDNKTLIAAIFWLIAALGAIRTRRATGALVLIAALVTLIIFSIPHSVFGSELDYGALPPPPGP